MARLLFNEFKRTHLTLKAAKNYTTSYFAKLNSNHLSNYPQYWLGLPLQLTLINLQCEKNAFSNMLFKKISKKIAIAKAFIIKS